PILMTAFAFILGVLPLVLSTGAGANSRQILGTTVLGGMLMATLIGVFIVPVTFYVSERFGQAAPKRRLPQPAAAPPGGGTDRRSCPSRAGELPAAWSPPRCWVDARSARTTRVPSWPSRPRFAARRPSRRRPWPTCRGGTCSRIPSSSG